MYKIAERPEAPGGLACCGQQKAFLIEKCRKLHDIAANLLFGDTEFRSEIVNNVVEWLLLFHHVPYFAAYRIDAETQALLNIKQHGAVLILTFSD
jgi:hypothetical protein